MSLACCAVEENRTTQYFVAEENPFTTKPKQEPERSHQCYQKGINVFRGAAGFITSRPAWSQELFEL